MSILVPVCLLLASPPRVGLRLEINSPHERVLVGEPFKLVVRWTTEADIRVAVETPDFYRQSLILLVRGPRGLGAYWEGMHNMTDGFAPSVPLKRDDTVVTNLVFVRGGYLADARLRWGPAPPTLLFDQAGRYSVKAVYVKGGQDVVSNTIDVTVIQPDNAVDREIMGLARQSPGLFNRLHGVDDAVAARARQLLTDEPASAYGRWEKLQRLVACQSSPESSCGTEIEPGLYPPGHARIEAARVRSTRLAETILSDANWGVFEEEALAFALDYARVGKAEGLAAEARRLLFEKYPHSESAAKVMQRESGVD